MRRIFVLTLSFFLLGPTLTAQQNSGSKQKPLVFIHVTVIDVTGGPVQLDRTVVILGGRITKIGESTKLVVSKDSQVVDATGKFLIPGLWDMHVHWDRQDYLPLFIANGVTGVRIMWGFPYQHRWLQEIEAGRLVGPRMVIASPIVDGPKRRWPGSIGVASEAEGRQTVIEAKRDGADFVKVYSFLPRKVYFAIADEAKKQGIPFEGHIPVSVSAEEASRAGQKTFEHLNGLLKSCSSRETELWQSAHADYTTANTSSQTGLSIDALLRIRNELAVSTYSQEKASKLFGELKTNHTWLCPTLTVERPFVDDPSIRNDPRLKYMPSQLKSSWSPDSNAFYTSQVTKDMVTDRQIYEKKLEIVGAARRAGVEILAGTDTVNPYCMPGFSLHDELGLLVRAGLTPMEALQTATLNPARFFGKEQEFGAVATGRVADLVLLNANPLDDIGNTRQIATVVYQGKLFDRRSLDAMLAGAEAMAAKKSVGDALLETINEKGVASATKQYRELRATQPNSYDFGENELDLLGYQLRDLNKMVAAIAMFRLNTEQYPESSNAYDSLADAYMGNNDKVLAIATLRKSLELNPKDTYAAVMLRKLAPE